MNLRRTALLSLTPLIAVVGCSADADEKPAKEAAKPVSQVSLTDPEGDVSPAGDVSNVDIVAAEIQRTAEALRVTITYDDLTEEGSDEWMVGFDVITSDDSYTRSVLFSRSRYDDSDSWSEGASLTTSTPEDAPDMEPCMGVSGEVDYEQRTLTITVPDTCLGDPEWLQVEDLEARSTTADGTYTDETGTTEKLVEPA